MHQLWGWCMAFQDYGPLNGRPFPQEKIKKGSVETPPAKV